MLFEFLGNFLNLIFEPVVAVDFSSFLFPIEIERNTYLH